MARGFKAVSVIASSIIAIGLSAGSAHAVFINGSVGLGDAGITLSNLPGSMVSALTNMTLGTTAVPGPCTVNFVGCNPNAPGTTLTLPLVSGAMIGLFSTPVGGTPFMWTFGTIVGTVIRTAPVNIGGNLITDSIQFIATGRVDDGPGGFDPTFAIINFNASGNCVGTGTTCNAGTATATWQATLSAAGTPTRFPNPRRLPFSASAWPVSDSAGARRPELNTSVDDDPAAAGFVISGAWCQVSSRGGCDTETFRTWHGFEPDPPSRASRAVPSGSPAWERRVLHLARWRDRRPQLLASVLPATLSVCD